MKIINYHLCPHNARADGVVMTDFFDNAVTGRRLTMGHGIFPPGAKVPPAAHTADDYSFILSGSVTCWAEGVENRLTAGCAGFIPAGETHESANLGDEPCHLIWFMLQD